jgi:hypothetical protein
MAGFASIPQAPGRLVSKNYTIELFPQRNVLASFMGLKFKRQKWLVENWSSFPIRAAF